MERIVIKTSPISVNKLYRGRRFLTNEGKHTKEAMAWEVFSQWKLPVYTTPVKVTIKFYFNSKRPDIDGAIKGLLDCLQGILWENDRLIEELHVYKYKDTDNPRTELYVESL